MSELYIGLMSGTSLDGVDGVLVNFDSAGFQVKAHHAHEMPSTLRQSFLSLNQSGDDELHRGALAANALVQVYSKVVQHLLKESHFSADKIKAIGAHGQTVRHQPRLHDGVGYTWQLNNPSLLAELTSISVVADFRNRDIAAGGQGAPLVPAFHQSIFGNPQKSICVLNLGGISNITTLIPQSQVLGFDCGPANALMDEWCFEHTQQSFDQNGNWTLQGTIHDQLLNKMLADDFFQLAPPKSTGRDHFNRQWLMHHLKHFPSIQAVDVQATLTALTVQSIAQSTQQFAPSTQELVVCGGGALNTHLMRSLQNALPSIQVIASDQRGLPAMQVEACAFAWLARQTILGLTGNLQSVTGAQGTRILGAIYPA
ncbi:MAG: anhydro-N-acetylmuramic acid kinase [Limnohabitans sp.]|nr:anhydro-N-acetylmuramic acid kinase [Limnohabitans sp.]